MGDSEATQGTLELTSGVAVVAQRARAEKTEGVGGDGLGQPESLESGAEVAEVFPGGVAGHETAGDVEAEVVVYGEQQGLLLRGGPPLVDGVVLPGLTEVGTAEAAVGAGFRPGLGRRLARCFLT